MIAAHGMLVYPSTVAAADPFSKTDAVVWRIFLHVAVCTVCRFRNTSVRVIVELLTKCPGVRLCAARTLCTASHS